MQAHGWSPDEQCRAAALPARHLVARGVECELCMCKNACFLHGGEALQCICQEHKAGRKKTEGVITELGKQPFGHVYKARTDEDASSRAPSAFAPRVTSTCWLFARFLPPLRTARCTLMLESTGWVARARKKENDNGGCKEKFLYHPHSKFICACPSHRLRRPRSARRTPLPKKKRTSV